MIVDNLPNRSPEAIDDCNARFLRGFHLFVPLISDVIISDLRWRHSRRSIRPSRTPPLLFFTGFILFNLLIRLNLLHYRALINKSLFL